MAAIAMPAKVVLPWLWLTASELRRQSSSMDDAATVTSGSRQAPTGAARGRRQWGWCGLFRKLNDG
jgi:hypothetical protein